MKLAIDKNASVEVFLSVVAEDFVFGHDASVHVADESEVGLGGVFVSVDFVVHFGALGSCGEEFLDHDKVWPACMC